MPSFSQVKERFRTLPTRFWKTRLGQLLLKAYGQAGNSVSYARQLMWIASTSYIIVVLPFKWVRTQEYRPPLEDAEMADAYNLLYDYQNLKTTRKGIQELTQAEVETLPEEEMKEYQSFLDATQFDLDELEEPFAVYEYMLQRRNAQLLFGTLMKPKKRLDDNALQAYLEKPIKKADRAVMALINAEDEEKLYENYERITKNEQDLGRSLKKIVKNSKALRDERIRRKYKMQKKITKSKQIQADKLNPSDPDVDEEVVIGEKRSLEEKQELAEMMENSTERKEADRLDQARKEFEEYKKQMGRKD